VLLLVLSPLALVQGFFLRRRVWLADLAVLASATTIAMAVLWGEVRGGSAYNAYYQLKSPLTGLLVGLLLLSTVRNSRDLRLVWATILAAALVRATLALYFFRFHARNMEPYPQFMTSHNDSLLWVAAVAWLLARALSRGSPRVWLWSLAGTAYLLMAIYVNARRLAWLQLILVLVVGYLLLPRKGLRRRANRILLMAMPVLVVYVAVGWERSGPFFAPLEALRTTSSEETDASTAARAEENTNLVHTFRQGPVLGTGWGHEYISLKGYYTQSFSKGIFKIWGYLPHNSLFGIMAFSGLVGFIGTWALIPVTSFLASRGYRRARRASDRAAAMAAVCVLPAYGVQAFGDMGFNALTCSILLGVAAATGGRVAAWTRAWPSRSRSPTREHASLPGTAAPAVDVSPGGAALRQ
jgi:hypothetical protein